MPNGIDDSEERRILLVRIHTYLTNSREPIPDDAYANERASTETLRRVAWICNVYEQMESRRLHAERE